MKWYFLFLFSFSLVAPCGFAGPIKFSNVALVVEDPEAAPVFESQPAIIAAVPSSVSVLEATPSSGVVFSPHQDSASTPVPDPQAQVPAAPVLVEASLVPVEMSPFMPSPPSGDFDSELSGPSGPQEEQPLVLSAIGLAQDPPVKRAVAVDDPALRYYSELETGAILDVAGRSGGAAFAPPVFGALW